MLCVVYRTIARHLIGKARLTRTRAATGAVTLIQRFGSALNLNIHFHMLFLDRAHLFKDALHAGVEFAASQREKLERLCRYVSRPPVASECLALSASGQVRYTLKTPYRDGTTHLLREPLDLMARLAALVPPPRMHLTRFHGVAADAASRGDELGAAAEARVWRRDRALCGLRPASALVGFLVAGCAGQGLMTARSGSP